ncbi:hypothetical protein [Caminibacter sp.]
METVLIIIGGYIVYGALQIAYFKYKEAKFQKNRMQKKYSDVSAKA